MIYIFEIKKDKRKKSFEINVTLFLNKKQTLGRPPTKALFSNFEIK